MSPCPCKVCELREHLEKRLALLSNIQPLDQRARESRWHRINELEQALQVSPQTPYDEGPSMAARFKSEN